MKSDAVKLIREYRETMPYDVMKLWAADVVKVLNSINPDPFENIKAGELAAEAKRLCDAVPPSPWTQNLDYIYAPGEESIPEFMFMQARGWGYYTGNGQALGLPTDEAIKRQDAAVAFVIGARDLMPQMAEAAAATHDLIGHLFACLDFYGKQWEQNSDPVSYFHHPTNDMMRDGGKVAREALRHRGRIARADRRLVDMEGPAMTDRVGNVAPRGPNRRAENRRKADQREGI